MRGLEWLGSREDSLVTMPSCRPPRSPASPLKGWRDEVLNFVTRGNSWLGGRARSCYVRRMTLKQQIHDLVEQLPDNSPLLVDVRETLRMNRAIGEALDDVREGRTFSAEEFTAKVQQRWPRQASA